jgi:hypothetical protein
VFKYKPSDGNALSPQEPFNPIRLSKQAILKKIKVGGFSPPPMNENYEFVTLIFAM